MGATHGFSSHNCVPKKVNKQVKGNIRNFKLTKVPGIPLSEHTAQSRLTVVSCAAKKEQSDSPKAKRTNCQKQNVRQTTVCLLHEQTFCNMMS